MTDVIVEFIRAQLAKAAEKQTLDQHPGIEQAGEWTSGNIYLSDDGTATGHDVWADDDSDATVLKLFAGDRPTAAHIARHDPVRVFRGVEAKRRLLDKVTNWEHQQLFDDTDENTGPYPCSRDGATCECGTLDRQSDVLRSTASEWSTHPDHRQEWRI